MSEATISKTHKVAIIGNPNVGKSTIFNYLTGLNQKIGNYPGVTVDKKTGGLQINGENFEILDLPGTYSLFPNSEDEIIAHRVLSNTHLETRPEYVLMVIDSTQLSRGLFLATQLIDLGVNLAIILNMTDVAEKKSLEIRPFELFKNLGVPILQTDARNQKGLDQIKNLISERNFSQASKFIDILEVIPAEIIRQVKEKFRLDNDYQAYQMIRFGTKDKAVQESDRQWLKELISNEKFNLEEPETIKPISPGSTWSPSFFKNSTCSPGSTAVKIIPANSTPAKIPASLMINLALPCLFSGIDAKEEKSPGPISSLNAELIKFCNASGVK